MTRVRLIVHTTDGETTRLRATATLRRQPDDRVEAHFAASDVLDLASAETVDAVASDTLGRVRAYRAVGDVVWEGADCVLTLALFRDTEDVVGRGSAAVEELFARVGTFLDRLVRNGWDDRATGRFAPKYKEEEEVVEAEAVVA